MDNDTSPESTETGLPRAAPFSVEPTAPGSSLSTTRPGQLIDSVDRTGIFGQLVKDDADIAGLVAYSIYKQNKLDWLRAFEAKTGRAPTDAELGAYIIGEGTPRRVATYRHLAEATLAGGGPSVEGSGASRTPRRALGADTRALTNGLLVTYALIAVLFVIILWFAAHFTTPR